MSGERRARCHRGRPQAGSGCFYVELIFLRRDMAIAWLVRKEREEKKRLDITHTERIHRGTPHYLVQEDWGRQVRLVTMGPSSKATYECSQGWDDVYGLAVRGWPASVVSDRSCTTHFLFDPAAPCMGILDLQTRMQLLPVRGGDCAGAGPGGLPSSPSAPSSGSPSARLSFLVLWSLIRPPRRKLSARLAILGSSAGTPAQIIRTVDVDRMILHRPTSRSGLKGP